MYRTQQMIGDEPGHLWMGTILVCHFALQPGAHRWLGPMGRSPPAPFLAKGKLHEESPPAWKRSSSYTFNWISTRVYWIVWLISEVIDDWLTGCEDRNFNVTIFWNLMVPKSSNGTLIIWLLVVSHLLISNSIILQLAINFVWDLIDIILRIASAHLLQNFLYMFFGLKI